MFCKQKMFLEISQNSQENTCISVSLKKECEFCEISKNTFFFFIEHLWATASVVSGLYFVKVETNLDLFSRFITALKI